MKHIRLPTIQTKYELLRQYFTRYVFSNDLKISHILCFYFKQLLLYQFHITVRTILQDHEATQRKLLSHCVFNTNISLATPKNMGSDKYKKNPVLYASESKQ